MPGPVRLDESSDEDRPLSLADLLNSRTRLSSSPPPAPAPRRTPFYRSIQQQASQLSLKTLGKSSYSNRTTDSHGDTRDVERNDTLRTSSSSFSPPDPTLVPSERSRLFGFRSFSPFKRWQRGSSGQAGSSAPRNYGALRLEDSDSEAEVEGEDALLANLHNSNSNSNLSSPFAIASDGSKTVGRTNSSGDGGRMKKTKKRKSWLGKRPLLRAGLQVAGIFVLSALVLGGTLWLALPTLDDEDRPKLRLPKSFEQLQDLNYLLKKYRDIYPFRIVVCFCAVYLFLQAFSLPGSMYLSILGGAVWGVMRALPLVCTCVATGASLCYALSAAFGPALLAMPKWKARLDKWAKKVEGQRANLLSFMIVIRISPLPPHWVVNLICPHIGIGIVPFWISTFLGIVGVTVIHTTIGGGLEEMTSAKDFRLFSWKNGLILGGIVIAVLIPVGIRWWFRDSIAAAVNVEEGIEEEVEREVSGAASDGRRTRARGSAGGGLIFLDSDEDEDDDDDGLEDRARHHDDMETGRRSGRGQQQQRQGGGLYQSVFGGSSGDEGEEADELPRGGGGSNAIRTSSASS